MREFAHGHSRTTSGRARLATPFGSAVVQVLDLAVADDRRIAMAQLKPERTVIPMRFHHVGIPTLERFEGEIDLPHLHMTVSDHTRNPFGIQWQRYWDGAPYPELVKAVPHVAFEVEDLEAALAGHEVIIAPNSPSPGVLVAFIKVDGAPVELLQTGVAERPDP